MDTTAPQVSAATVSPSPVPTPTAPVTIEILVEFKEPMATSTAPKVTFGKISPYNTYSVSGAWIDDTKWEGTSSISSGVETGDYRVSVSQAKDVAGNLMAPATGVTTFTITTPSKVEKEIGKSGGTVELGDGTKVEIPAGALQENTSIYIELIDEDELPVFPEVGGLIPTGLARVLGPAGLVFAKPVIITIPYTEDDIPEGVEEKNLCVYFWDGTKWRRTGNETVYPDDNLIKVEVNHFAMFRIVGNTTSSVDTLKVYLSKNPFLTGTGTYFTFNLPREGRVTLNIYDAAGDLVRILIDNKLYSAGSSSVAWKGANDFGGFVGSGLYIYKLEVKYTGGGSDRQIRPVDVIK